MWWQEALFTGVVKGGPGYWCGGRGPWSLMWWQEALVTGVGQEVLVTGVVARGPVHWYGGRRSWPVVTGVVTGSPGH